MAFMDGMEDNSGGDGMDTNGGRVDDNCLQAFLAIDTDQEMNNFADNLHLKSRRKSLSSKNSIKSNSSDGKHSVKSVVSEKGANRSQTVFLAIKDTYCWDCHKSGVDFSCKACLRSYHQKCSSLKRSPSAVDNRLCPECTDIMKAEEETNR
ncbi:unnamed protein product, partial [Medioppia subpectinata]